MAEEKKGIVKTVIDGFKESYNAQKEIDKENFRLEKDLAKARFAEATKPNPDFEEFKEAKGIKEKAKTVGRHMKRNAQEQREKGLKSQRDRMSESQADLDDIRKRNGN